MLFRENNICATVPSLVIDDHFSPFVLARFQVETFNKSGGSRKSDLIQIQFLTNHTTDALDRDLEKHVWFHGTYSMFTNENCQTLSDRGISREKSCKLECEKLENVGCMVADSTDLFHVHHWQTYQLSNPVCLIGGLQRRKDHDHVFISPGACVKVGDSLNSWTVDVLFHISVLRRCYGQWSSGKCGTTKKYKRRSQSTLLWSILSSLKAEKCCQIR